LHVLRKKEDTNKDKHFFVMQVRSEKTRKKEDKHSSSTSSANMRHCAHLMTALEASAHEQSRTEDKLHQLLSKLPKVLY
jgi:hypothetical protein